MMRDESSLRRQWTLLKTLSTRRFGVSVRELAGEAGVSVKTIRRDLELFRTVGLPLDESVGEFGRKLWKLANPTQAVPLSFSYDEALALHLGRRLLEPLAGTPFWAASRSAFQKIRSALGSRALELFEDFTVLVHHTTVGASDYRAKEEQLDLLHGAMEDCKAVHILYQSDHATEPAERDVYPYGLVFHGWSLYLVAFAPRDDKIKTYKVDRIEDVEVSPFPFQRPKDFDLGRYLERAFGVFQGDGDIAVAIRFAPAAARYVLEGNWHHSQVLTRQRDGSLLAEFRLGCTQEIKSWVLGFGRKAVVLAPESLRREIAEELEDMAALYEQPGRVVNHRARTRVRQDVLPTDSDPIRR